MTSQILEQLDAAAQRIETPCGDGSMVWRVWNPGAGTPLLLLHGGTGSWRHWIRQIPRFAAERCVIAPDLAGLGDSATPPEPHDPDHVARIVVAGLPRVVGTVPVDLVGFSFGANVAGHVAAHVAEGTGAAIRSLLLAGAGAVGLPRNITPLEKIRDKEGAARVAAHRRNLAALMIADPARIDDLALEIQEINTVLARLRSRSFAGTTILKDALARTAMPLCALWGERDHIAVGQIPERVAAVREARPDAAAAVIPGAGHWVMYEAPEAFDDAVVRFQRSIA